MKYLIEYKLFETMKAYDITDIEGNDFLVKYYFTDIEENRYLVQFKNDKVGPNNKKTLGTSYEFTYYVWDSDLEAWSVSKIVNTNVWNVLRTVFGVVMNDFIEKRPWLKVIRLEGLAKDKEREFVTQRTKLYVRHLTNNPIPNFTMENYGNRINLIRKDETRS